MHVRDGGWRKQAGSQKKLGRMGGSSKSAGGIRALGEGEMFNVQCSIFVSSSFSVSSLSSVWGAFSFSSSSVGFGELLLTVENRNTKTSKSRRQKRDRSPALKTSFPGSLPPCPQERQERINRKPVSAFNTWFGEVAISASWSHQNSSKFLFYRHKKRNKVLQFSFLRSVQRIHRKFILCDVSLILLIPNKTFIVQDCTAVSPFMPIGAL